METSERVGRLGKNLILVLVLSYILVPIVRLGVLSVTNNSPAGSAYTMAWYSDVLGTGRAWEALVRSAILSMAVGFTSVVLGFLTAWGLRGRSGRWFTNIAILLAIPALMPTVVSGFVLHVYFGAIGIDGSLLAIFLGHLCYASPVAFFLLHLALRQLDSDLERCARNLGASERDIVAVVVLPQMRVSLYVAGVFCGLLSWDEFMIAWFVGGFNETLPLMIYGRLGSTFDNSIYAIGSLVTLISVTLVALVMYMARAELSRLLSRS